jgi:hypothetical protein
LLCLERRLQQFWKQATGIAGSGTKDTAMQGAAFQIQRIKSADKASLETGDRHPK